MVTILHNVPGSRDTEPLSKVGQQGPKVSLVVSIQKQLIKQYKSPFLELGMLQPF